MHKLTYNPNRIHLFDMERAWTLARKQMAPTADALRKTGCRVSFYRESLIVTFPKGMGGGVCVTDCIRGACSEFGPNVKRVPSMSAALGVAYGRRFMRGLDFRRMAHD